MLLPMLAGWGPARGQDAAAPTGVTQTPPTTEKPNPLKRRLSDREKIQQQKDLKQELHGVYKTWLERGCALDYHADTEEAGLQAPVQR